MLRWRKQNRPRQKHFLGALDQSCRMTIRKTHNGAQAHHPARVQHAEWSGAEHLVRVRLLESEEESTHDPVALHQRANSRLRAHLHVRSHIFLPITIDIGTKIIPKAGLGRGRAL
jgi:hypothetical protein